MIKKHFHFIDKWYLLQVLAIPLFGLIVLYSAGYDRDYSFTLLSWPKIIIRSEAFLKQLLFLLISCLVFVCGMMIPREWLKRWSPLFYLIGLILLIAVAFFGVVVNGSRRWLALGSIRFQPAEPMKFTLVVVLATWIAKWAPIKNKFNLKTLIIPTLIVVIPMILVIKQPDLGTALAMGAIGALMTLFIGIQFRTLLLLVLLGTAGIIPSWNSLRPYQRNRIIALLNPESDPRGTGYHINQSKIAVGSGQLFGKGYMQGTQSQLQFLPEHTTDFIFSVLAEEWGFVGCIVVLTLYLLLILRILFIANNAPDLFSLMIAVGIASILFFHVVVNIGMVLGVLPVVGIPLPLFSYGGSSFLFMAFCFGIVARISADATLTKNDLKLNDIVAMNNYGF
jgi:rod shape determining protein RodA